MLPGRRRRPAAGFVLPTTVLLVLVVTLTASALSYRAFNNSSRVIGNVQSKAIYNAATPAVDRARAKLDFLFGKDTRLPGGVPGEEFMISMMLNDGRSIGSGQVSAPKLLGDFSANGAKIDDPYTLTDETRVDVNGDGFSDNAWIYRDPGTGNSVVYAVNMSTPDDLATTAPADAIGAYRLLQLKESEKAQGGPGGSTNGGPYVRSAPLSNNKAVDCPGSGNRIEQGWYEDAVDSSILRKRFQVDSFVVNPSDVNSGKQPNFVTLEFAQDRQLDRGNKWGAWFRYDLEAFPGRQMNWNGAMHSEGNILIGGTNFNSYLISSQNSCLFLPRSNSEVSVREFTEQLGSTSNSFKGVIAAGTVRDNAFGGSAPMHVYNNNTYDASPVLTSGNDWHIGSKTPSGVASDPVAILTDDLQRATDPDVTNSDSRLSDPKNQDGTFYDKRFEIELKNTRPYVDDTYRADNRWGPKVQYKGEPKYRIPAGSVIGSPIDPTRLDMVSNSASTGGDVGLDGYWERRTFAGSAAGKYSGGMRILVGERLELGNPFGWVAPQDRNGTPQDPNAAPNAPNGISLSLAPSDTNDNEGDPLNPPYNYVDPTRAHESKQRRALRDNLAAVQASAIYHYRLGNGGQIPAACLITTSHPGTPQTLARSVDFTEGDRNFGSAVIDSRFDFFTGKGTNGWEFSMPAAAFDSTTGNIVDPAMLQALQNLAYFAGDPDGAFPPKQEAGVTHPDPSLTMFGNFSNLRRALATPAANRSPADISYMHTAACTLGALGYNINQIQQFNPSDPALQSDLADLGSILYGLIDGVAETGNPKDEILPRTQLATYGYTDTGASQTPDQSKYNPRDYDRITPELVLAKLKQRLEQVSGVPLEQSPDDYKRYRLAELIHESYQIRRDRTYGFRPSPAANTWNVNPFLTQYRYTDAATSTNYGVAALWSSACDPNLFKVGGTGTTPADVVNLDLSDVEAQGRLALSRLCGTVIPSGAVHDYPGDYNYPARGTPVTPAILPTVDDNAKLLAQVDNPPSGVSKDTRFTSGQVTTGTYGAEPLRYALVAPKFPALYYIFPEFNHDQDGSVSNPVDDRQPGGTDITSQAPAISAATAPAAVQPWAEPYIARSLPINGTGVTYVSVPSTGNAGLPATQDYGASGVAQISPTIIPPPGFLVPTPAGDYYITDFNYKAVSVFPVADSSTDLGVQPQASNLSSWVLPATGATLTGADTDTPNLIRYGTPNGSTIGAVPFIDRVLFDGRQWLPNRILDIDLNMLRTASRGLGSDENWLPVSGIVYAFREDARREDAINRPANALGFTDAQDPSNETDPAVQTAKFNISIKPVDYIADPDRRDHGFRLRNGATLKRTASGIPTDLNRGLSFFSDNSVYFLGSFNLHNNGENGSGDRLEEFTVKLPNSNTYSNAEFYDNRIRDARDKTFADPTTDFWRASEVLADSITILSKTFCDGGIIDTFTSAGQGANNPGYTIDASAYNDQSKALFAPGCNSSKATSFLNQNRPSGALTNLQWVRENPNDPLSPVKISRNGNGLVTNTTGIGVEYSSSADPEQGNHNYMTVRDGGFPYDSSRPAQIPYGVSGSDKDLTNVNSILISGIVPSRALQSYGGMHNFPRLLERWGGVPLRIGGSFLQLNFSNYATAPYDQEVWEPNASKSITPTESQDMIGYFGIAPDRLWGYDVALKLVPASPAASRFTTPSTERNEFYEEPKVNDPYMQRLCGALSSASTTVTGLNTNSLKCPT